MLAAQVNYLAVHQNHLKPEQIVGGDAVFEAVHTARVLGHVPADGAGNLARGVGCVVEAVCIDCLANGEIGDARLDHRTAVRVIDLEHFVELG